MGILSQRFPSFQISQAIDPKTVTIGKFDAGYWRVCPDKNDAYHSQSKLLTDPDVQDPPRIASRPPLLVSKLRGQQSIACCDYSMSRGFQKGDLAISLM